MLTRCTCAGWRWRAGLGLAVVAVFLLAGGLSRTAFAVGWKKKQAAPPGPPPVKATLPPAFTVPVEPLGFSPPGDFYLGSRNTLVSLDFLDEDHLLFTFRVPGLIHRVPGTEEASWDERRIRVLVLKLPQGTVQSESLWTLHDRARYLWMVGHGQFLLRDGDNLKLGDASLELRPYLHFPGPVLTVAIDPAGQYLVAQSAEPPTTASEAGEVGSPATAQAEVVGENKNSSREPDLVLRILRRDSGKVMLVSHIRSQVRLAINDEAYLETLRGRAMNWMLNLNYFTGGSAIVGSVESVCSPDVDFISTREIMATTCMASGQRRLVAVTTKGKRLWDLPVPETAVWPNLVLSPDGLRLARETLTASHGVNASAPLGGDDIRGQDVTVMDAATGKVELRALASPIFDAGGNVAFSPSGRKVAVLMKEGIQVFDLPAAPPLPDEDSDGK